MAKGLTTSLPPSDPTAGYWNFTAGTIILMYIIYVASKGELPAYIQLFLYSAPSSPPPTPAQSQTAAAPGGTNTPAYGGGINTTSPSSPYFSPNAGGGGIFSGLGKLFGLGK